MYLSCFSKFSHEVIIITTRNIWDSTTLPTQMQEQHYLDGLVQGYSPHQQSKKFDLK